MKKIIALATALAISLCMLGCGTPNDTGKDQDNQQNAEIGETVPISTQHGDLEITVEAFEDNAKATEFMLEYGHIKDTQHVGLLKLVVKNISYEATNSSLPDYVDLPSYLYVADEDGVSLNEMNTAIDVDEYKAAAGAFFECQKGESKRIAVFYPIETELKSVSVHVGDSIVDVPVTSA